MCHRQIRPMMDFGFLSYLARKGQWEQLDSAIFLSFLEIQGKGQHPPRFRLLYYIPLQKSK